MAGSWGTCTCKENSASLVMDNRPSFNYFVKSLSSSGKPPSLVPPLFTDKGLIGYNRKRFNFYDQFLRAITDGNTLPYQMFGIVSNSSNLRTTLNEDVHKVATNVEYLNYVYDDPADLKRRLDGKLMSNLFTKQYRFVPRLVGGGNDDKLKEFEAELEKVNASTTGSEKAALARKLIVKYENDPIVSPDNVRIRAMDRIVFMATTFVIRGVTLFLIEWAMNSYMITGFEKAYQAYMIIYMSIFILLAILVNASMTNLVFRMAFYYMSTVPHGVGRILLHVFIQFMLLPVPFLVKDGTSYEGNQFTFERRRSVLRSLSQFTFFIWVLTSAVAVKY
jgi:hypothetical protein